MIDATGAGPGPGAQVSALLITSRAGDPRQAAQVANDLAASLMTQDAEERTRTVEELVSFLDSESRRLNDQRRTKPWVSVIIWTLALKGRARISAPLQG